MLPGRIIETADVPAVVDPFSDGIEPTGRGNRLPESTVGLALKAKVRL